MSLRKAEEYLARQRYEEGLDKYAYDGIDDVSRLEREVDELVALVQEQARTIKSYEATIESLQWQLRHC